MENSVEISEERFYYLLSIEKVLNDIILDDIKRRWADIPESVKLKSSLALIQSLANVDTWARNKYAKYCIEDYTIRAIDKFEEDITKDHYDIIAGDKK